MKPFIIPIFIPNYGCPNQCIFCDQSTTTGQRSSPPTSEIPNIIDKHINSYLPLSKSHKNIQIAFYGGTFTGLPLSTQKSYLEVITPYLKNKIIHSVRLSTRPDYIDQEKIDLLKAFSVKTIELGVQSMDDEVLRLSQRGYTSIKVKESSTLIKKNDLELGIQLMPGLPGDTEARIMETSHSVCKIAPDFLRVYPAIVIKNTLLEKLYLSGDYKPLSLKRAISICKSMLVLFQSANIPVIRVGLQPTKTLLKHGTIIAGPFHPAFRQLVISNLFYERLYDFLQKSENLKSPSLTFSVHPSELSNYIGNKKENIKKFKKALPGLSIRFQPDKHISQGSFCIENRVFSLGTTN